MIWLNTEWLTVQSTYVSLPLFEYTANLEILANWSF